MTSVTLDRTTAALNLHKKPFQIKHELADHPLFTLPALVDLAAKMPRDKLEYNGGDLQPGQSFETIPRLDMSAGEVIDRIENHNAWMVIKRVDEIPQYRAVLEKFLLDMFAAAGRHDQQYSQLEGFVFVSSAKATTPFHIDAEENILTQIRGSKSVHIFDNEDRSLISEEHMEISPSRHRYQSYQERYEQRARVFHLQPGDGVHIPYIHPHWVRTHDEYSVSMAMTWKTPEVERLNKIRLMNGTLRHYGWPQNPPGISPLADSLKVGIHDTARLVIDPLRRSEKIRGFLRGLIYGKKANYYYNEPAE